MWSAGRVPCLLRGCRAEPEVLALHPPGLAKMSAVLVNGLLSGLLAAKGRCKASTMTGLQGFLPLHCLQSLPPGAGEKARCMSRQPARQVSGALRGIGCDEGDSEPY